MFQVKSVIVECRLTGRQLARQIKASTPTQLALLADDLSTGRMEVKRHTARQARLLTGCSFGYQNTVAHLEPHERQRVRCGFAKLSDFHNNKKPTERQIEHFLNRADFDLAYKVFERMLEHRTRPAPAIAAE
jgi:hypothetical protein